MKEINWVTIYEYAELTGLDESSISELIERGKLTSKEEEGIVFIDPEKHTSSVIPVELQDIRSGNISMNPQFVEKTIGTIINLHEKVLGAKDETIESIKNENSFLKDGLSSLQELYDEDRKTIEILTAQLKHAQQEVEFMRRKYKLMWGKVVDDYSAKPEISA
jgi:hypothetical protein